METVHGAGGAAAGRVFRGVVSLSWSSAVSPQSSWVPPLLARQPPAEREREFGLKLLGKKSNPIAGINDCYST